MQSTVWKFSAVAGVLGICLLAVLQVQESLSTGNLKEQLSGLPTGQPETSSASDNALNEPPAQVPSLEDGNGNNEIAQLTPFPEESGNPTEEQNQEDKTAPSVFDEKSVAGLDLNNPLPEEELKTETKELEPESLVFNPDDEPKEPKLLVTTAENLQPVPVPNEETGNKTEEEDSKYNLNGIELASNEEPQEEESESKGPTLFAQNETPSADKPEELSSELTDNAVPLEGNPEEAPTETEEPTPFDQLEEENGLKELPTLDEEEATPEVSEDPFSEESSPETKDDPADTIELEETPFDEIKPLEEQPELDDNENLDILSLDEKPETPVESLSEEPAELKPIPEGEPVPEEEPESLFENETEEPVTQQPAEEKEEPKEDSLFVDEPVEKKDSLQLLTGEESKSDTPPLPEDLDALDDSSKPKALELQPEPKTGFNSESASLEEPTELESSHEFNDPPKELQADDDSNQVKGTKRPQLKIEKVAPKNSVLGKPLIYSILIKNVGDLTANKVVVEDQIPKGTKLTGTIPQAEWINNRLIWKFEELPPGEQQKIAIRVIPQQPGRVGSVATVRFATEIAAETVITAPGIDLEVKLPQTAQVGEEIILHFSVRNKGNVEAKNVIIRNILPKMFAHADGNDLEYEVGTMAAGETKDVSLKISASKVGKGFNQATVSVDGNVTDEVKSNINVQGQRLELVRRGPKTRFQGKEIIYTNTVKNKSKETIQGAKIVEKIPEGLEFKAATQNGEYDREKRMVSWDINTINPEESREYKVKLVAHETGVQSSHVSVIDTNGTKSVVNTETNVKGYTALALDVSSLEAPLNVGETVAVKVLAQNRGTTTATNVRLNILIPDQLKIIDVDAPIKFQKLGNQVHLIKIPEIKPKSNFEVKLALKVVGSGDVRLTSSIDSDQMNKPLSREEPVLILGEE